MKICLLILNFFLFVSSAIAGECDFIRFNKCQSCDDPYGFWVGSSEACAFLCPNRVVNYNGSGASLIVRNCVLKQCPEAFPFQSKDGNCFKSKEEADNDSGTDSVQDGNNDNIQKGGYSSAPFAQNGKCPQNRPLLYSDRCFSCDETDDLSITEDECKKCPNRIYKFYPNWEVGACEIPCPEDKPLQRWDGTCFSCDEPKVVRIMTHCNIERDCEICPNRTILYDVGGNVPSIPNCPEDKPLIDSEGICYSCDTPVSVGLGWGNNSLCDYFCPNERHLEGNKCVLNESGKKKDLGLSGR